MYMYYNCTIIIILYLYSRTHRYGCTHKYSCKQMILYKFTCFSLIRPHQYSLVIWKHQVRLYKLNTHLHLCTTEIMVWSYSTHFTCTTCLSWDYTICVVMCVMHSLYVHNVQIWKNGWLLLHDTNTHTHHTIIIIIIIHTHLHTHIIICFHSKYQGHIQNECDLTKTYLH